MSRLSTLLALVGAVCVSATLLVSTAAYADESPAVEALIQRGIQLRRTGDDEAALAVFLQAESESPTSVRVLLHVVTAAQAAGKWLMADEYMRKVSQDKNDAYYRRHRTAIEQVEAAIAQRVGSFQALGAPEGAEVRLNGEAIGKLPMAEPKSLETGTYILEVINPGYYNLRRPISVTGGVLTREAVELRERKVEAQDTAGGASGSVSGGFDRPPPMWWQESWVTWTLGGIALAGAATTTVGLVIRERQADKWNDEAECIDPASAAVTRGEFCTGIRDDIRMAERIALVGGITAGVFGVAALTHWLATASGEPEPAASAARKREQRASMGCSPGVMSLVCQGSF